MLIPRQPVPDLRLPTLSHGPFDLAKEKPGQFTLVVFYRGLHCPVCAAYLGELSRLMPEYEARGVAPIAISSDGGERAHQMAEKIKAESLRFGHSLPLETARAWGLAISTSRGKTSIGIEEPPLFSEPGLFLIKPDGTLYYGAIQTMPFARPHFDELLKAIDFVVAKDYPARGEYAGALA